MEALPNSLESKAKGIIPLYKEGKVFGWAPVEQALSDCVDEGYRALFMPEIVEQRILQGKESPIWDGGYTSLSLMVSGRTRGGKVVVVFAHVPHYFSDPKNIRKVKQEGKTPSGAGELPKKEFYRLLDLEDAQKVYVVDYSVLKSAHYGEIGLDYFLRCGHPMVRPFLGVPEEDVVGYLRKLGEVTDCNPFLYFADAADSVPRGRLLFLGGNNYCGLYGYYGMYFSGRFVGVRERSEQLAPKAHQG